MPGMGTLTRSPPHRPNAGYVIGKETVAWARARVGEMRRVEMWRGGGRSNISVAAPFVWRCLTGSAVPADIGRRGYDFAPHANPDKPQYDRRSSGHICDCR